MLPIARNQSFHVPHGLAAVAAGVCLVLAFTAEFSQRQAPLAGSQPEPAAQMAASINDSQADSQPASEGRAREGLAPQHSTRWIPWFPGLRPGGG